MATIIASSVIKNAQTIIQDVTGVRWPEQELLGWLNEGQREVVLLKPDSFTKNASVQMVPGTKQELPGDGVVLTDVIRNMGADGLTPGGAIRRIDRAILDDQLPGWHTFAPAPEALYYVFDERDPRTFYLYPPQPNPSHYMELSYSASPTNVVTVDNTITLDDIYSGVILDYILFRAYSKDTDYAGSAERAGLHYQKFLSTLGAKEMAENAKDAANSHGSRSR